MNQNELEQLINQTLDGALQTIPIYIQEIEQNKTDLKVGDTKEFVFGVIVGMVLGMTSAAVVAMRQGIPTEKDHVMIKDIIYSKIPLIRDRIFS